MKKIKETSQDNPSDIVIYEAKDNKIEIRADIAHQTIWLTQKQMSELFEKDVNTIIEHTQNIYSEGELNANSTTRKFRVVQTEGKRKVSREVSHYNLDVVISVGYRVNSKKGTQFRIWATNVLRKYLVEGYAINQNRLEADAKKYKLLQTQVQNLRKVIENESFTLDQSKELVRIITDYAAGLELIDRVDHEDVKIPSATSKRESVKIDYKQALTEIAELKNELHAHNLFGNEKDNGFKSALQSIFQTFGGEELYPSIEEKAANLLYLIIKNHPFTDGNKRIGSYMFVRFLDLNGMLYLEDGRKLVEENALVAIALLIAQSDMKQKELMVNLVVNLITTNE